MNLNKVTAELRPRGDWEAVDFGARMVRRDARTIYKAWFATTLPLLGLACLGILYSPYASWMAFVYWWLEPLTDGIVLHVVSRRLFGETVSPGATLRQLPRITRANLIFLLPPYRFHFARSTAIPITQLEGLRGKRRRARAKVLNSRIMNFGIGLTTAYHHLFLALYLGVAILAFAMIPVSYQGSFGEDWFEYLFGEQDKAVLLIQLGMLYIAQTALHPWFVGAGFGLYINCRTRLEAWDIEVSFRRLAGRHGLTAVVAVALLMPLAIPDAALAEEDGANADDTGISGYWDDETVRPIVDEIYASEALQRSEDVMVWKRRNPPEQTEPTGRSDMSFFLELGRFFAFLIEIWLWLLVAALLLLLFATRNVWLPYIGRDGGARSRRPRVILASGEITEDSLPSDIPAEVRRLWASGRKRDALSLLFRGNVFYLVTEHELRVPPSATEGACVDAVRLQGDTALSGYFERVVKAWIVCAYGAQTPEADLVQSLCDDWPKYFNRVAG